MPNNAIQRAKKRNLILFLGVIILAGMSYGLKEHDRKNNLIYLPIAVNNLNEMIIHQSPAITLKKINNIWFVMLDEPQKANRKAIQDIFDMLSSPVGNTFPVSEVSLKELSLEPPNLRVELNDETLSFGSLSPIEQMHYVQLKDNIYLASPFLQVRFTQSLNTFLLPDSETQEPSSHSSHGHH